jgi:hypothetical protein
VAWPLCEIRSRPRGVAASGERAGKPDSVPDDCVAWGMTIYLGCALARTSVRRCSHGRAVRLLRGFERSCFGWGLPEPASPRNSVSSYLTISPLLPAEAGGGMFLWHFPSSRPDRTLSCTLPDEARTFLTH